MKKVRATLSLDADLVEALKALEVRRGGTLSALVNSALREALEVEAHRAAFLDWMDELDAELGAATSEEKAANRAFLDAAYRGEISSGDEGRTSVA